MSATGWTTGGSINVNDYYEFTVGITTGYTALITTISVYLERSPFSGGDGGPTTVVMRSSVDGYASNIGTLSLFSTLTGTLTGTLNQNNLTGTVTFRIYGYGAENGNGRLSIGSASGNDISVVGFASTVLPINLLSFTGQSTKAAIHLTWTTASELNNDYMAVERSPDGLAFDEIGRVAGRGTTHEAQTYAFVDEYPLPGVNYYRLRQVDYDGTTEHHPVISVVFAGKAGAELRVRAYPNPAREELRVEWTSPGRPGAAAAVLRVFDSSGRQLAQYALNGSGGVYNVPVGNLPAGVYVLQLAQGKSVETMRFVKE